MPQNDYGNPTSPFTGTQLNNRLRDWRDALHSLHRGTSRPTYAVPGMLWLLEISSTEWRLHLYDGDTDILLGTINPTANTFTPAGVTGFAPLTGATFTGAVVVPNATADGHAVNRITGDGRYARLTGATFTGDVSVAKSNPALILDKTASGQSAQIFGRTNGSRRWLLSLGNTSAEGGGNTGSNFVIRRYDDSGAALGDPVIIDRASGAMTLGAPLTLPGSDPTDANHAARKAYVDAQVAQASIWEKIADATVSNSTIIDITGFSLQNYRMVRVMLLGVRLSSAAPSPAISTMRIYRGGTLVTAGYIGYNISVINDGISGFASSSGSASIVLTSLGLSTDPLFIPIDIAQTANNLDVLLYTQIFYISQNSSHFNIMASRITSGSAWVDGIRITFPNALQANVGRIIVLGLKP